MRPGRVVAATALVLVLSTHSLPAQVLRPDTLILTLEEAYRIAARSNPVYRQALNATTLNGPETRESWFNQILPSVSLTPITTT